MSRVSYNRIDMSGNGEQRLNQSGMVSFMVTLIMMAVITLIVVGFSQVTHRNQREALDRQLSTQAFYAAESGVNVTKAAISSYLSNSPTAQLATKQTCKNNYQPDSTKPEAPLKDISSEANVRYTCVLVDPNPSTLIYDDLTQGNSIVVPITTSAAIDTLSFNWTTQSGLTGSCSSQARSYLPPDAASWNCPFALLRVDLMQVPDPNVTINNVAQLSSNTATMFLTPYGDNSGTLYNNATGASNASLSFGGAATAYYGAASGCSTSPAANCVVNARLANPLATYYARITPLYHNVSELVISAKSGVSSVKFNGTQAVVDVTGQAQDELRRIQVRVGLQGSVDVPADAVASSNSICKNFTILPSDNISDTTVCQ